MTNKDLFPPNITTHPMYDKILNFIEPLYNNENRIYHNMNHIRKLIDNFVYYKKFLDKKTNNVTLFNPLDFIAIMFHDAIITGPNDEKTSEELSANFAESLLTEFSVFNEKQIDYVKKSILFTNHEYALNHEKEATLEQKLIHDVDYLILSKDSSTYGKYVSEIALEYTMKFKISMEEFLKLRLNWIKKMLNSPKIYFINYFRIKSYEEEARKNLRKELISIKEKIK